MFHVARNSEVRHKFKLEYRCCVSKILKLSHFSERRKIRQLKLSVTVSQCVKPIYTNAVHQLRQHCNTIDRSYVRPISARQKLPPPH